MRECSDCRENEKTFRNNFHYKCVNENCENYIAPIKIIEKIEDKPFDKDNYIKFLENQISNLTTEINLLRYKNSLK